MAFRIQIFDSVTLIREEVLTSASTTTLADLVITLTQAERDAITAWPPQIRFINDYVTGGTTEVLVMDVSLAFPASNLLALVLPLDAGALTLSGAAATLTIIPARVLTAEAASLVLSGDVADLLRNHIGLAAAGTLTLTGTAATFARGIVLEVEAGALSLSGAAAGFIRGWVVDAQATSLVLSGQEALLQLLGKFVLLAEAGALTLTGSEAVVGRAYESLAAQGSLLLTGQDATLARAWEVLADAGSLLLTPTSVALFWHKVVKADLASLALRGADAKMESRRTEIGWGSVLHPPVMGTSSLSGAFHAASPLFTFGQEVLHPTVLMGHSPLSSAMHPKADIAQPFPLHSVSPAKKPVDPTIPPIEPPPVVIPDPPPTLTSVVPVGSRQGSTVRITLRGTGFVLAGTSVMVSGSDVSVSDVLVSEATALTADVWITPGATPDARQITVSTVNGTSNALTFTVTLASFPSPKAVLGIADFTYLGVVYVPNDWNTSQPNGGIRFGYSKGPTISTRRVDGNLHLLIGMSQAWPWVAPLCELVYDKAPSLDPAVGKALSTYHVWGDIYGGLRKTVDSNGFHTFGYHWDGEKLIWSFGPTYSPEHCPTLGATVLHPNFTKTVYGPWRTQAHAKQTNGPLTSIPAAYRSSFGGHDMLVGGIQTSVNSLGSWGHTLEAFTGSTLLSTPGNPLTGTEVGVPTKEIMKARIDARMLRSATWKSCTKGHPSSDQNHNYNCADGSTLSGVRGDASDLDTANGGVWIENANRAGYVFVNHMVDRINNADFRTANYGGDEYPHEWYATDNANCCHGQKVTIVGTGPHTPSLVPQLWFYDPATLMAAGEGAITTIQASNTPSSRHHHLYEFRYANFQKTCYPYDLGCAYDPVDRLFFVNSARTAKRQFEATNTIHVFQVAD